MHYDCSSSKYSQQLTRRGWLRVGALGGLGMTLPRLLQAEAERPPQATTSGSNNASSNPPAKAKSCILFFMEGGPSHVDLWDMKPNAPEEVRGIFQPIATSVPGLQICEHLPRWAPIMKHLTTVRSVSHSIVDHNASSHYMLTGQYPMRGTQLIRGPSPQNAPPFGSVLAKLRPSDSPLPDYVHIPKQFFNCGDFIPGVLGGLLGDAYDPFVTGDPSSPDYKVPGLEHAADMSNQRLSRRQALLHDVDSAAERLGRSRAMGRMGTFYEKAFSLITSPQMRQAFEIKNEPESVRLRYGLPKSIEGVRGNGLPHLGQSMLLARRLVEAGVRLVSVWAGGQAFDTHAGNFQSLAKGLCPPMDMAFSALIEDLEQRGMLDETLVVALAEFGRTPRLGQATFSAAITKPDGRDHWPHCYTMFLAGAGVKRGLVYGASDPIGGYPAANPVSPNDMAATIYTLLGIDPHQRIYDSLNRPHTITEGTPVHELLV